MESKPHRQINIDLCDSGISEEHGLHVVKVYVLNENHADPYVKIIGKDEDGTNDDDSRLIFKTVDGRYLKLFHHLSTYCICDVSLEIELFENWLIANYKDMTFETDKPICINKRVSEAELEHELF